MAIKVIFSKDPAWVLAEAGEFLSSDPVQHNLILSLLNRRVEEPEPGRYWVVKKGEGVAGVAFQSPLTFYATITPMDPEVVSRVVDAVVDAGVALPGVSGAAATAALFAGQWTERTKSAGIPLQGQRIYEAAAVQKRNNVNGNLRRAEMKDRDMLLDWLRAFYADVGMENMDPVSSVNRRLPAGLYWLWEDGAPVSLAGEIKPVEGIVRIGAVYTPPEWRRHGYAGACVAGLTEQILDRGLRPILYTDLGNPVSNSVYRRIGYRAVAEVLLYKFE